MIDKLGNEINLGATVDFCVNNMIYRGEIKSVKRDYISTMPVEILQISTDSGNMEIIFNPNQFVLVKDVFHF